MRQFDHLGELYDRYDIFFCDVWGVLHNGIAVYPSALAALKQARKAGKGVFLVTNSPRQRAEVAAQLKALGLAPSCYDGIVTSGDVTRDLIKKSPRRIFHIGPDRDCSLYDGLDVELVEEFEAAAVVCTGLFDDENGTPDDYQPLLQRLCARNLPFICANPDIVVRQGDQTFWCAGALARIYTQLGGRTLVSGKPHRPIYDAVCGMAEEVTGRPLDKSRVLAIGDGILTDVKGADLNGIDVLFIGNGIHVEEYAAGGRVKQKKLDAFFESFGMKPAAFMMELG